jgi:hypothetical protein
LETHGRPKPKTTEEYIEIFKKHTTHLRDIRFSGQKKYEGYGINLSEYINNYQIINSINTLHLHSCKIDLNKVENNKILLKKVIGNKEYVNFIFDKTEIKEINYYEYKKICFINKSISKYKNIIDTISSDSINLLNDNFLENNYSFILLFYELIYKEYNKYINKYSKQNVLINKINNFNVTKKSYNSLSINKQSKLDNTDNNTDNNIDNK